MIYITEEQARDEKVFFYIIQYNPPIRIVSENHNSHAIYRMIASKTTDEIIQEICVWVADQWKFRIPEFKQEIYERIYNVPQAEYKEVPPL